MHMETHQNLYARIHAKNVTAHEARESIIMAARSQGSAKIISPHFAQTHAGRVHFGQTAQASALCQTTNYVTLHVAHRIRYIALPPTKMM